MSLISVFLLMTFIIIFTGYIKEILDPDQPDHWYGTRSKT